MSEFICRTGNKIYRKTLCTKGEQLRADFLAPPPDPEVSLLYFTHKNNCMVCLAASTEAYEMYERLILCETGEDLYLRWSALLDCRADQDKIKKAKAAYYHHRRTCGHCTPPMFPTEHDPNKLPK